MRKCSVQSPLPSALARLGIAALLAAAAVACRPSTAPERTPDGRGLVLEPYDGPLGKGVTSRDPRLEFHDFGRVSDGDTVARVFRLTNTDPREVSIQRVDPGCGCTVAALRALRADGTIVQGASIRSGAEKLLTVGPGEVAEIEVRVATREIVTKNADKLITLRVLTDSPNAYFLTLEVHILVEKPFAIVPATLALGSIPENGGGEGKVEIVPAGHFFHELKELLPLPAGLRAELRRELRNGTPLWVLTAALDPPLALGQRSETLRIASEESPGVPGRELEVPLTALVVGDFTAEPGRLVFAAPRDQAQRSSLEFRSLLAGHRIRLSGVEVPEQHRAYLLAHLEPVAADDAGTSLRWLVTLETIPPLPEGEVLSGSLCLRLDDPGHPSHELGYVVHLR